MQYSIYTKEPGGIMTVINWASLNGKGNNTTGHVGINWFHWRGWNYSLKFTEMKIHNFRVVIAQEK